MSVATAIVAATAAVEMTTMSVTATTIVTMTAITTGLNAVDGETMRATTMI